MKAVRKANFVFLLLIVSVFRIQAQADSNSVKNIATFCKVWGFLKYYHPNVAKGKLDWDKEFMDRVLEVPSLKKSEVSRFYLDWIKSLGKIPQSRKYERNIPDSLKFNLDQDWLGDTLIFNRELIATLQFIRDNRAQGRNHYIQQTKWVKNTEYHNEKEYKDSVFPRSELRMLGLARYWNVIEYFYPYRYLIDEDWNKVLIRMVPKFRYCNDTMEYHLALRELTARIDDTHGYFRTPKTTEFFGELKVPFGVKIIDTVAIVHEIYDDSLCGIMDVRIGDVILKIDEKRIHDIVAFQYPYIAASNHSAKLRNIGYTLMNGNKDTFGVTVDRDGTIFQRQFYRYKILKGLNSWKTKSTIDSVKIYDGNIGCLNLDVFEDKNIYDALVKLKNTRAIIFDARRHPNGTMYQVTHFLNDSVRYFAKVSFPDLSYPGVYHYSDPIRCGAVNPDYYKGMVVILFSEITQSHGEFTVMALQTAPGAISVGSQTAGADGNVSYVPLPGGYYATITGIGIYYPDGGETQRVGIVPDIEVKPTIEGIRAGRDEVLEKALGVIHEKLDKN